MTRENFERFSRRLVHMYTYCQHFHEQKSHYITQRMSGIRNGSISNINQQSGTSLHTFIESRFAETRSHKTRSRLSPDNWSLVRPRSDCFPFRAFANRREWVINRLYQCISCYINRQPRRKKRGIEPTWSYSRKFFSIEKLTRVFAFPLQIYVNNTHQHCGI